MKTIIFGGSGFLGSHVADVLTDRGYDVLIFDKVYSPYLKKGQKMILGDILDERAVHAAVQGTDYVYNFSALADIDEAHILPIETVKVNVLGNVNILEASKNAKVKRFVYSSSIYVFGDAGSFYRSSKQSAELFIENYQKIYGLDSTILRYGSLYGPRSNENNWIYRILKQALLEKKITRHGDGEEIREYIHVQDAARLSVDILKDEYRNRRVIITGNDQMKIKDLLTMVREILKNDVKIEYLPAKENEHYTITPYVFNPQLAMKIHGSEYVDMGQGFLNILAEIYKKNNLEDKIKSKDSKEYQLS